MLTRICTAAALGLDAIQIEVDITASSYTSNRSGFINNNVIARSPAPAGAGRRSNLLKRSLWGDWFAHFVRLQ